MLPITFVVWVDAARGLTTLHASCRERVPMVLLQSRDVDAYVTRGIVHATSEQAQGLPGYNGLESASEQQLDAMGAQQNVFEDD